jgi:transcription elongation factor SPT6
MENIDDAKSDKIIFSDDDDGNNSNEIEIDNNKMEDIVESDDDEVVIKKSIRPSVVTKEDSDNDDDDTDDKSNKIEVDDDDDDDDAEEEEEVVKKKTKRKRPSELFDNEAEQSSSDDSSGDDEKEENENEYQFDGFVVGDDDDNSDDDDDDDIFDKDKDHKIKKKKLKRLKKVEDENVELDEDEIALLRENEEDEFYEDRAFQKNDDDNNDDGNENEIAPISVEDKDSTKKKRGPYGYDQYNDEGSDLDGWIDNGDDDLANEMEGGEDDNRDKLIQQRRPVLQRRDGPSFEQLKDAEDIFGAGYDDFDDEDEEEVDMEGRAINELEEEGVEGEVSKGELKARKLIATYDHTVLVENFCTEYDDDIRLTDLPERLQSHRNLNLSPVERTEESLWIAKNLSELMELSERTKDSYGYRSTSDVDKLQTDIVESIQSVLKFIQVENYEIPFIWSYRRDYLHPKLTRKHLWTILAQDEKWGTICEMRKKIIQVLNNVSSAAESIDDDTDLDKDERSQRIKKLISERNRLRRELKLAQDDIVNAEDTVEIKDEDATAEDRQKVEQARESLESIGQELTEIELSIEIVLQEITVAKEKKLIRANYRPEAASEVMRLFPGDKYIPIVESTTNEIVLRDIFLYLDLLLKGSEAVNNGDNDDDVDFDEMELEKEGMNIQSSKVSRRKKITSGKNLYRRYRRMEKLRDFAESFSIPVCEFGYTLRHNFRTEPPPTNHKSTLDYAAEFIDGKYLKSEEDVLKGVRILLASELAAEPSVRDSVRKQYKRVAVVNTRPTPKGITNINPFNSKFGIHYLVDKPLIDFFEGKDRTLFIRLKEAEKNGEITITINLPQSSDNSGKDLRPFLQDAKLFQLFMPSVPPQMDPYPDSRETWDGLRISILEKSLEQFLLPQLEIEARREMLRIGRETIVDEASDNFSNMVSYGPYVPAPENKREATKELLRSCPERPHKMSVASIILSQHDHQPIFYAFIDKDGVLRSHDMLPERAKSQKKEKTKQFITKYRPDIVVVNSSGGLSSKMMVRQLIEHIIPEIEQEIKTRSRENREERENRNDYLAREEDEDEFFNYKAHVLIAKDEISNIFMGSSRSKKMFPEFQPGTSAAVCLARFVREPLAEYCHLWTSADAIGTFGFEAEYLDIHPLKHLLRGVKAPLLNALEKVLVGAVCDIGVDLNMSVSYDHLSSMLAFVGGLGLRKADSLRQQIRRSRPVSSRKELQTRKLLGTTVWNNAAGFLRIYDVGTSKIFDPLDNTRIHPECYIHDDFAPKICADALEVENTTQYIEHIIRCMTESRRSLESKMKKYPDWVDLWEKGRPLPSSMYKEQIRTKDGRFEEKESMCELPDVMAMLILDDYAQDLETNGKGKRRLMLEDIKEEIRYPFLDLRPSLPTPTEYELFKIITAESDSSLYVGLKLGCIVNDIYDTFDHRINKRRQFASVTTETGLRGNIDVWDIIDDRVDEERFNISDILQKGQRISAVVIGVQKIHNRVDLSIKPSHLASNEDWWLANRNDSSKIGRKASRWFNDLGKDLNNMFDKYFSEKDALSLYRESEMIMNKGIEVNNNGNNSKVVKKKKNKIVLRQVYHPLFANVDFGEAEERLFDKGAGEVLIRPSSKGANMLSMTWAFQNNRFKHIDIEEKGSKEGALGLCDQLHINEDDIVNEPYGDIDEIYSRYIEPMNEFVRNMVEYAKFIAGSQEVVENMMRTQLEKSPGLIPYYIRMDSKAGRFVLTWLSLGTNNNSVKKEVIVVRPSVSIYIHNI